MLNLNEIQFGGIVGIILLIKLFFISKIVKKSEKTDYGKSFSLPGLSRTGNDNKIWVFYENVWVYYDDGIPYSIDVDGLIIDRYGVPYKLHYGGGLIVDDAQVNRDYDSGEAQNRVIRAKNKKGFLDA